MCRKPKSGCIQGRYPPAESISMWSTYWRTYRRQTQDSHRTLSDRFI